MLSVTPFTDIASFPYDMEAQVAMVNMTIAKMIEVAKLLLLPFLLIRLVVHYMQYHLALPQLIRSCYTSIVSLCVIFLMLHYYIDLFNMLDRLTCAIMQKFDCKNLLSNLVTNESAVDISPWNLFKQACSNLSVKSFKWVSRFISSVTNTFRKQAIIFTLQVGPLAIAGSLLPGNFSHIAGYWFNMLISFLMWGVTIDLLDYATIAVDLTDIGGIAAAVSNCLMYGLVGPLTSIYVGNTVGNSLFSLGETQQQKITSFGYYLGKKLK